MPDYGIFVNGCISFVISRIKNKDKVVQKNVNIKISSLTSFQWMDLQFKQKTRKKVKMGKRVYLYKYLWNLITGTISHFEIY